MLYVSRQRIYLRNKCVVCVSKNFHAKVKIWREKVKCTLHNINDSSTPILEDTELESGYIVNFINISGNAILNDQVKSIRIIIFKKQIINYILMYKNSKSLNALK